MAWKMKLEGHACGRHRARRLMRLMRLVPIDQAPNTSKKHPQHKVWPYLFKGMAIIGPNKLLGEMIHWGLLETACIFDSLLLSALRVLHAAIQRVSSGGGFDHGIVA